MLKLTSRHRIHVPNKLAMLAAVLLLVSSIVGTNSNPEDYPMGVDASLSAKVERTDNDNINDAVKARRRGLNLGFLLFRRG